MLMALYLSPVLCQTSSTVLLVHLQRQWMNMISKVPMCYMGLGFFGCVVVFFHSQMFFVQILLSLHNIYMR